MSIVQSNSEFVMHHSNDTIQFKDASIPTGTKVTILSMIGVNEKIQTTNY